MKDMLLFRLWRPTRASWFIWSVCLWKHTY